MRDASEWPAPVAARVCAATAATAGAATAVASQHGTFPPSALVKVSADEPLAASARAADHGFRFVTDAEHYDGVYYYAIARDPFARATAHGLIDQAPYRYGHPLHGWLAGLLSMGRASAVPGALLLLSIAGLALAGWAASRLVAGYGGSPWWGLAVAVSPGLLYAATVSTTETLAAGLVLSCLLAARTGRWPLAYVFAVLCCFDKEVYVFVPLGLIAMHVAQWRRREIAFVPRHVAWLLLGPVLLACWFGYVHTTLHRWSFQGQDGNLGKPFAGWNRTLEYAHDLSGGSFEQSQLGALTPPMLIGVAMLVLAACIAARGLRTELDGPVIGLTLVLSCQGWRTLLYPHELLRIPAVVALLAVLVLAPRDGTNQPRRKANSPISRSAAARSADTSGPALSTSRETLGST